MDEVQTTKSPKKNLIILGVTALVIVLLVIGLLVFLRRPVLISPLAETGDDLRIIFVSPESSVVSSASPSASTAATPVTSPTSRPSPRAISPSVASPRSTPISSPAVTPVTSPKSSPTP